MKKIDKKKQGRINLRRGREFERIVRSDLEKMGFFVSRWGNNVDLSSKKIVPAKQGRFRKTSTGFPDFIAYTRVRECESPTYHVIGVECKRRKYLSKEEKEKARVLLRAGAFDMIYIAYPVEEKEGRKKLIKVYYYIFGELINSKPSFTIQKTFLNNSS